MKKCTCGYTPTIIVPGIGQSKVDLYSLSGKRIKCAWPLDIDEKALIKEVLPAAAGAVVTRNDERLCKALKKAVMKAASPLKVNSEGAPVNNLKVVDYDGHSIAECTEDEKRYIYRMVPMQELSEVIGEDHMFFFAYNSFGQPYETAKALNEYINNVKQKTGHDKVNLVPVSLGGSIATAYFDAYGNRGDVDRVCYFVPAANGSTLLADVFSGNIDFNNTESFLGLLFDGKTAKQITGFLKHLPKDSSAHISNALLEAIKETVIVNSPAMWAVIPHEHFAENKEKYLVNTGKTVLKAKAERFYRAQSNLRSILLRQSKSGVKFFSICGYDNALLPFAGTKQMNSDTIVDFKSASLGGTAAKAGETLPANYKPAYDNCSNKKHNHISPENTVDLSTSIFPDSVFCFRYQIHDDTAYNDVALSLCKEILTNENFTDVYSDPRFPQFNGSRNIFRIKYRLLPKAYELLKLDLVDNQRNELEAAVKAAQDIFGETIIENGDKATEATKRLSDAVDAATPDYRK